MNNEINEEKITKNNIFGEHKANMQGLLLGFLFFIMFFVILIILFGGASGITGIVIASMVGLYTIFGVATISIIASVVSIVNFTRNRKRLSVSGGNKVDNIWFAFDMFFFLFLPVVSFCIIYFSIFRSSISFLIITIILANGIKVLLKNKNNDVFSRLSGWLLIIFGLLPLVISFFNFLIIKFLG